MGVIYDTHKEIAALGLQLCGPSLDFTCAVGRMCVNDTSFTQQKMLDATTGLTDKVMASCTDEMCQMCLHKTLTPFAAQDVVGTVLLFITGILAGASGIGGGGLNVPLLMIVQGFIIEEAVPLSHMMVLGNAVAQNIINLQRSHPKEPRRPMVDFDVPLLLLPVQLGGNALGVIFEQVVPKSLLLVLACCVLLLAATKTLVRGVKDFKQERLKVRERSSSSKFAVVVKTCSPQNLQ